MTAQRTIRTIRAIRTIRTSIILRVIAVTACHISKCRLSLNSDVTFIVVRLKHSLSRVSHRPYHYGGDTIPDIALTDIAFTDVALTDVALTDVAFTVVDITPADGATEVGVDSVISLTYSKEVTVFERPTLV
jgi:hypothetical protein